jgi:hypothetical protein
MKNGDDEKSPVKSFIYLERSLAAQLIHHVDDNLKSIYGFVTGTMLLSEEIKKIAIQLGQQQVG